MSLSNYERTRAAKFYGFAFHPSTGSGRTTDLFGASLGHCAPSTWASAMVVCHGQLNHGCPLPLKYIDISVFLSGWRFAAPVIRDRLPGLTIAASAPACRQRRCHSPWRSGPSTSAGGRGAAGTPAGRVPGRTGPRGSARLSEFASRREGQKSVSISIAGRRPRRRGRRPLRGGQPPVWCSRCERSLASERRGIESPGAPKTLGRTILSRNAGRSSRR